MKNDVLIVDDELDICYLLAKFLKDKNFNPQYVHSIADARRHLLNHQPGLIFLDNHLPDGLGITIIREIKSKHRDLALVMITAFDEDAARKEALSAGADYFVSKPFNRETINTILSQYFM